MHRLSRMDFLKDGQIHQAKKSTENFLKKVICLWLPWMEAPSLDSSMSSVMVYSAAISLYLKCSPPTENKELEKSWSEEY